MDAHLEWSIKLSLLMYATSAPGGGIRTDGVTSERGQFRFPLAQDESEMSGASSEPDGSGGFTATGSVSLFAHHGMPITTLAGLQIRQGAEGWSLQSSPAEGEVVNAFTLSEPLTDSGSLTFGHVTLTAAGSEMFSGYYQPGEEFDPLTIRLTSD